MNSEEPIENEKIRFNKLKKFIWISYGKYVIICLLIEKTKKKGGEQYINKTETSRETATESHRMYAGGEHNVTQW